MKKIYLSISVIACALNANAQLSLTKAFNEPVLGDIDTQLMHDSVNVIPKNTGAGQLWDFSTLTNNTLVVTNTFTTVASTPNGANYPAATLADDDGQNAYNYYKSSATQYEIIGIEDPIISLDLTNGAVAAVWPIGMGYSNTDLFSGNAVSGFAGSGTASGTITVVGSGTGTLVLPSGISYTNILQVKSSQRVNISLSFGAITATLITTDYSYYHASEKFPLLTVSYSETTGSFPSANATVKVNNSVVTGVNDLNFDAAFSIFPNPAKSNFNVKLHNQNNADCNVEINNAIGQTVKVINLGNDTEIADNISISDLSAGMYFVKTTLGNKVSTKKLIVE